MKKLYLFTCFLKFCFHNNHFEKNALRSLPKAREMKNMFSVHLCDLIQNKDKQLNNKDEICFFDNFMATLTKLQKHKIVYNFTSIRTTDWGQQVKTQ